MTSIQSIISRAQGYLPNLQTERLHQAYDFALRAHRGLRRKSGLPYITHPLETAQILLDFHVDEDTLIASLLHDVPEDTEHTLDEIESHFGKTVSFLVDGITKLSKVQYRRNMKERQIKSLKKLFFYTAQDPRTILIKLADRLHNMRTLEYVKDEKKHRIAIETMEIFVPIAKLLGIWRLKTDLEECAFQYLYPDDYKILTSHLQAYRQKYDPVLKKMMLPIQSSLTEHGISHEIFVTQKNLYSIFQFMKENTIAFDSVDDLMKVQIVVDRKIQCYQALGVIHTHFKPKAGSVMDYISVPKSNGYRGLHTRVFGLDGLLVEFQIRSQKMHCAAEYGITMQSTLTPFSSQSWLQQVLELQGKDRDNEVFFENLKRDILQDRIFVFTPKGEVKDLPHGATALDFAYSVHTDVGHTSYRAEINHRQLALKTILNSGDTVRIITDETQKGPRREWLNFVITHTAQHRIKEYFRRESRADKLKLGYMAVSKEFEYAGKFLDVEVKRKKLMQDLLKNLKIPSVEKMFIAVGEGTLSPRCVLTSFYSNKADNCVCGKISRKNKSREPLYRTVIKVFGKDSVGHLRNVADSISSLGVNIIQIESKSNYKKGKAVTKVEVEVKSFEELSKIFDAVAEVDGVQAVQRMRSWFTAGFWLSLFYRLNRK